MANSDITLGAQIRAIGNAIGMSEDQVIQMVIGAQRKGGRQLGRDIGSDEAQAAVLRRLQKVQGVNADIPEQIDDLRTVPNRVLEYGEGGNQDELQNFGGLDKQGNINNVEQAQQEIEKARGKRDSNLLSRTYFEKGKSGPQREEIYVEDGMPVPARFVEPAKNRDFGIYQEGVAAPAAQVQRMELDRLQQGVDQYGPDVFGGVPDTQRGIGPDDKGSIPYSAVTPSAVGVIGQIEDDIYGNRGGEQALVREMVMRDRQRQNSQAVEANNWRAQAAANLIGQDFQVGGRGAAADQAMENIGQIAELGPAKIAYDFEVSRNPVDRGTAIPDSLPLNLPDQYNAPATDNRFAGPLQRQEQWLVDALGAVRDPNMAGDYPDVGINEQLGAARKAIQNAKIKGQSVDLGDMQIRNIGDLQAAADQVIALGQQRGVAFFNNVDGKNVANPNPGIGEVLERGGMNARQVGDVAKAGFAVEAAMRNPANQGRKGLFQEGITLRPMVNPINFGGDHPALGGGAAKISMLNREKVEGKEVKGQLQKLDGKRGNPGEPLNQQELADARMPFQAGVAGEGVPRARFVNGADRGLTSEQIYEKYGPVNGQIANAVIQRAEQAQGSNPDGFGARVARQRNMDPVAGFDPGPDPWSQPVGTGNGISQEMSRRSSGNTQKALPYGLQTSGASQGPTRPLTTELKNELAALSSGYSEQGPRPASNYSDPGIKADGPTFRPPNRKQVRAEADYRKTRRYGRNAAIAGGAAAGLAGLDALIGGERDNREQEQYQ